MRTIDAILVLIINNTTGYYGVYTYHDTGHYRVQIRYNGKNIMIGVYEDIEIAAGAYNCFIDYMCYGNLNYPRNPVRTITPDEMVSLNLMTNRPEMCNIVDTNKPKEMCRILK